MRNLNQDLARNGRIEARVDRAGIPTFTTAAASRTVSGDGRGHPAAFDDSAGSGQSGVVFEEQVDLSGTLSTLVDGPDDQGLTSTSISARPDTVDTAGIRL